METIPGRDILSFTLGSVKPDIPSQFPTVHTVQSGAFAGWLYFFPERWSPGQEVQGWQSIHFVPFCVLRGSMVYRYGGREPLMAVDGKAKLVYLLGATDIGWVSIPFGVEAQPHLSAYIRKCDEDRVPLYNYVVSLWGVKTTSGYVPHLTELRTAPVGVREGMGKIDEVRVLAIEGR